MKSKLILDYSTAQALGARAMEYAATKGWNIAVAIVDDGGHPMLVSRTENTSPVSVYIAQDKARTAAISRRDTKLFEDEINSGRIAFLTAPVKGAMEGGIPLKADEHTIGAVGIAGAKPHQAAEVAMEAVNLFNQLIDKN